MLTYVEPRTGRTQQVQKRERVRIAILERIGWRQKGEEAKPAPKPEILPDGLNIDWEDYDGLKVREVLHWIQNSLPGELVAMREYEAQHKDRITVLKAIDDALPE